jgi:hypothetical protein
MDLNCLIWIVNLGMAEQRRLKATSIVITPLVSSLPTVTVEASTRAKENCTFHPWSTWDVLGEHVEVVAHAIGGVCCSNGVTLGDMEERVAFPEILQMASFSSSNDLKPMASFSFSNVSTEETWEPLMDPS